MTYSIGWHPKVRKFLQKLPKEISERILIKVRGLQEDPFRFLEHYEGKDYYKFRVGDYRLLIDVDFQKRTLSVEVIGHRGTIYQREK